MKTLKAFFTVATVLVLAASSAQAGPFTWNGAAGIPSQGTKLRISLANFEYGIDHDGSLSGGAAPGAIVPLVDSIGDEIRGIYIVDTISDFNNPGNVFWQQASDAELSGYFSGYFVSAVGGTALNPIVDFVGGITKIFFDDTPDFDSDFSLGGDGVGIGHGDGFADGTLFLDLVGAGGIKPASPGVTLTSSIDLSLAVVKGAGNGYFDIVGGIGEDEFVADAVDPGGVGATPGNQDLQLANTITVTSSPGATEWPVTSGDPITGIATPEPTSLTLLGIGGLITGVFYRRKRKVTVA